jgi:dienelactone hydrolase
VAVRRGYLACIYFAADPRVTLEQDDSDRWIELYPGYDFACLGRWAWAAMRAVDYLVTRPDVDKGEIALTGHSRGGKQALLAAAFDERIGAVLPLSGNTGEGTPWRYTTDMFVNESIEQITGSFPHWFHPRLRFFAGREDKLPVDQNMLAAMVAPRALLLNSAYAESQGNPWGFEQTYRSAREVYRLLHSEDKLGLYLRAGEHMPSAEDIEVFLDFFDRSFGRRPFPKLETFVHGYTFEAWKERAGTKVDPLGFPRKRMGDFLMEASGAPIRSVARWNEQKTDLRQRLLWTLGEEPAGISIVANRRPGGPTVATDSWIAEIYKRPLKGRGMKSAQIPFGDELVVDIYYPDTPGEKPAGKWPVVLWLHPYAYATGYSRYALPFFESLVKQGLAVAAFDQIGFGTRVLSAGKFYERYPNWSLMGKMVSDTRAAIDALSALEMVDGSRVVLAGYALGGKVGLLTAALDERVRAVAAICGFSPFRLEGPSSGTEGLRHYSHLHGLIPRLGFFLGNEERVPFDYDEVIAAIAPRPVLVVAPELDRYAPVANVRRVVEAAAGVYRLYGQPEALTLDTPFDFNRLSRDTEARTRDWLAHVR